MKKTAKKMFKDNFGLQRLISLQTGIAELTIKRAIEGKANNVKKFEIFLYLIELGKLKVGEVTFDDFWKVEK